MARIPISITRILEQPRYSSNRNPQEHLNEKFIVESEEKGNKWNMMHITTRRDLSRLRDDINDLLGLTTISEQLNCSIEQAESIFKYQEKEDICLDCHFKNIVCIECINTCQSPLEQQLFLSLKKQGIITEMQWRINKDGIGYSKDLPIDKARILTIPDFYFETSEKKICIYADGHTYHERTEKQALRDRSIDRELQSLGFVVLRFTGKEIRENIGKVINAIRNYSDNKPVVNNV